jgi:tubulin delta
VPAWARTWWRRFGALPLLLLLRDALVASHASCGTRGCACRDEYPAACVISQCVWPYETGEVIVQNYNTLLTLASLLDAADGIVLVQNEGLHAAANRLLNIARHVG